MWQRHLKRLAVVLLALGFLVGTMPQMISAASAQQSHAMAGSSDEGVSAMHGPGDGCRGMAKHLAMTCAQAVLCVAACAAAVSSDPAFATMLEWTPASFPEVLSRLTGRAVAPALFPPIAIA